VAALDPLDHTAPVRVRSPARASPAPGSRRRSRRGRTRGSRGSRDPGAGGRAPSIRPARPSTRRGPRPRRPPREPDREDDRPARAARRRGERAVMPRSSQRLGHLALEGEVACAVRRPVAEHGLLRARGDARERLLSAGAGGEPAQRTPVRGALVERQVVVPSRRAGSGGGARRRPRRACRPRAAPALGEVGRPRPLRCLAAATASASSAAAAAFARRGSSSGAA